MYSLFNDIPTYVWPVAMSAVFMHTKLCCTRTVQTPGWAPHKIDIPIAHPPLCFWGLPWLGLLNQHYLPMCGKTYNTEDSIGTPPPPQKCMKV